MNKIKVINMSEFSFRDFLDKHGIILLRISIVICVISILGSYDIYYEVSFAEEFNNYNKQVSDWDLRYNTKYNPNGDNLFTMDLLLFTAWWGIFLFGTLYIK